MIITTCWILWIPSSGAALTPSASASEIAVATSATAATHVRATAGHDIHARRLRVGPRAAGLFVQASSRHRTLRSSSARAGFTRAAFGPTILLLIVQPPEV